MTTQQDSPSEKPLSTDDLKTMLIALEGIVAEKSEAADEPASVPLTQDILVKELGRLSHTLGHHLGTMLTNHLQKPITEMTRSCTYIQEDWRHIQAKFSKVPQWVFCVTAGAALIIGFLGAGLFYLLLNTFSPHQPPAYNEETHRLSIVGDAFLSVYPTLDKKDQEKFMKKMRQTILQRTGKA